MNIGPHSIGTSTQLTDDDANLMVNVLMVLGNQMDVLTQRVGERRLHGTLSILESMREYVTLTYDVLMENKSAEALRELRKHQQ